MSHGEHAQIPSLDCAQRHISTSAKAAVPARSRRATTATTDTRNNSLIPLMHGLTYSPTHAY